MLASKSKKRQSKLFHLPVNEDLFNDKYLSPLEFSSIEQRAQYFANHIAANFEEIADILLEYESFEVVNDEKERTLDLLKNLKENEKYFSLRVGPVASFLPKNQPLYALTCFVIVPSLMATEVHFRIPHSMRHFFPRFLRALNITQFFPNVIVSHKERLDFLRERSALRINPKTQESMPLTEVVIFTGTSSHAERLRIIFDRRSLFITNGSGHNPVVVAEDANIFKAVNATIDLQLYNQGQDCAAPNSILVHHHSFKPFMRLLQQKIKEIKVGHYSDRSCRVGPISDPEDLKRIQAILVDNHNWIEPSMPGIIRTSDVIVEPTIISKPLKYGGNFTEVFAPIFFVQSYKNDSELSAYFKSPHYSRNAMYITVYGNSKYIKRLVGLPIEGKILHDQSSILIDTHLHMPGVERGTKPYGGFGYAASSISMNGAIVSKPTLPQRDIYENIVCPLLSSGKVEEQKQKEKSMTKILSRDVVKLLGLKTIKLTEKGVVQADMHYIDSRGLVAKGKRYIRLLPEKSFVLLQRKNVEHIATLEPKYLNQINVLRFFIEKHKELNEGKLQDLLYSIAKNPTDTDKKNHAEQVTFFKNIYQLLLGKDFGPRLVQFLIDADRDRLLYLLNV